jgi:hypothetical protein
MPLLASERVESIDCSSCEVEVVEQEWFNKVVAVRVLRPFVLDVRFADGHRREVDIEPFLWGEVFAPLREPDFFARAFVDEELGTVAWPNGADLSPEFLYYGHETPYGRVALVTPQEAATLAHRGKE